jgi:hypothetical protein
MWISQLFNITPNIELSNEIIQFNGVDHPQKLTGPFGGTIHVLHVPHKWYQHYQW